MKRSRPSSSARALDGTVSGRTFPLFTDAHIQQNLVKGLTQEGWEIERAVDVFPERTTDDVLFEYAAKQDRVFVTNDGGVLGLAKAWRSEGRTFKGMVFWKQVLYYKMSIGDFVRAFDGLAEEEEPFAEPIRYLSRPT